MKIVIVGDGKVGYTLTKQLTREGHDVVVIDSNPHVLQELQESLDVMALRGNGASLEVQRAADVANSDLLIAATSGDEINLLCCILAKKLGCRHTIARVRNPEYHQQVHYLKEELGLSMVVNPEQSAAREIFRLLQFPSFIKRDSFAKGRVELVELKIKPGNPLVGVGLFRLYEVCRVRVLVCAVDRGGKVTIPKGDFVLQEGDKITVTAAERDLARLIKNLGITTQKVHSAMIIGGSRIASYLAQQLLASRVRVKIVEEQHEKCTMLSEQLPGALIIHGNGAQQSLLLAEGLTHTDAFVTLTGMDEENVVLSLYASHMGVPKCITKINSMEFDWMFEDRGLESVISPKLLTANEIVRYVRAMDNTTGGSMLTLHRIVDGNVEALEFHADAGTRFLGVPLSQLSLRSNILIACINHENRVMIPTGGDWISGGDTVIVVTPTDYGVKKLNDIFQTAVEH